MNKVIGQTEEINLQEAKRFLPNADLVKHLEFAERQYRSRQRFTILKTFYKENYCRLARLHLLATCAITLGRFAGYSKTFDQMGSFFLPVDENNEPRTQEWREYVDACKKNLPIEVREELWLAAHFKDSQTVRENGLYEAFEKESEKNKDKPIWQYIKQHIDVTLGVRLMENSAIGGFLPYETAFADSLVLTVKNLVTDASKLAFLYTKESVIAVLNFSERTPSNLTSYRRTAFEMLSHFLHSFRVSKVFRRGLRSRERGRTVDDEKWNLLEKTLGKEVSEIHPLIREFYANPSRFNVTATLKLETLPARFWSRFLTTLLGQGLYEDDLEEIPARLRIFEREDGSMHFIRELYCKGNFRVFDSDFVVKNGILFEIFKDLNGAVELHTSPIENQGLSIAGTRFLLYGRTLPSLGFHVDFRSRAKSPQTLHIDGQLSMKPKTKFGKFFAHGVLRRPKDLGSIHYVATRKNY